MTSLTVTDLNMLNEVCDKLLLEPGVRFAGLVNHMGNRIAGGFKDGISPYVDYTKEHMMYMELVLDLKMRSEFNNELGPVEYIHSRRGKVNMISIPLDNLIMVIATEREVNVPRLVNLATSEFESRYKSARS